MNKKTIAIIVIVMVFLIGIGTLSAGLIKYYGKITGAVTILAPEIEDDCKDNGWKNLVTLNGRQFKNQGDCVSYIQTHMCEDFELLEGYSDEFDSFSSCVSYFANQKKLEEILETSLGEFKGRSLEDNFNINWKFLQILGEGTNNETEENETEEDSDNEGENSTNEEIPNINNESVSDGEENNDETSEENSETEEENSYETGGENSETDLNLDNETEQENTENETDSNLNNETGGENEV